MNLKKKRGEDGGGQFYIYMYGSIYVVIILDLYLHILLFFFHSCLVREGQISIFNVIYVDIFYI